MTECLQYKHIKEIIFQLKLELLNFALFNTRRLKQMMQTIRKRRVAEERNRSQKSNPEPWKLRNLHPRANYSQNPNVKNNNFATAKIVSQLPIRRKITLCCSVQSQLR